MMDVKVPDPPGTCVHEMFCAAATVDKDQRLFSSNNPDQRTDPFVLLRLDDKEELLLLRDGRDKNQFRSMTSVREPVQDFLGIPDGCRESYPLDLPFCQPVHAVEQHSEVHAPH